MFYKREREKFLFKNTLDDFQTVKRHIEPYSNQVCILLLMNFISGIFFNKHQTTPFINYK